MRKAVAVVALLAAGIGAYGYLGSRTGAFVPEVRTVTVSVGEVVDTVVATGSLEAVTTVQVGSQVSGIIRDLYVDYNSIVRAGDVIMRLDPSLFETQTEQARANLLRAEADVERLEVAADDARVQLARSVDLAARELISATELEAAEVGARAAAAQLKSAAAQVVQARAALRQHEVNLEHTVIRAPIDGIVISRLVDVGQTVAASLQAPELFVIAADLTKMRAIANIDESDVGRIRPRQRVTFTVDAYPADEFTGTVSQIRLEPVVQQNVVTYATVVDAPNPDLKLKPGMTATITLEIARRDNVPRIPNAALRFRPTPATFAALNQDVPAGLLAGAGSGSPRRPSATVSQPGERRDAGARAATAQVPGGARGNGFRERLRAMSPAEREQFRLRRQARGLAGAPGRGAAGRGREHRRRSRPAGSRAGRHDNRRPVRPAARDDVRRTGVGARERAARSGGRPPRPDRRHGDRAAGPRRGPRRGAARPSAAAGNRARELRLDTRRRRAAAGWPQRIAAHSAIRARAAALGVCAVERRGLL